MLTQQTSFERFEYKYWVSDGVADKFMQLAAPYLRHDDWAPGGQRNTSLYLDSPDLDFMRLHTESAPDRVKLRVRAYGDPPTGPAFFEIKRKVKAVTFKRRAIVPFEAIPQLLRGEQLPWLQLKTPEEDSTLSQFLYLMLTHRAEPKVLVTCLREAFTSIESSEDVRLTLDREVCYQPARNHNFDSDPRAWIPMCGMGTYQAGASTLLELKFRGTAPWWIEEVTEQLNLTLTNYSKYVAAMNFEELGFGEPYEESAA